MIRLEGLERQAGTYRLEIEKAEIQSGLNLIVGANGAGKTTLIELLTTLQAPDAGEILYSGRRAGDHLPLIRSQIGYVPADIELYGDMKVGKLLTYMAELKGVFNPEAIDRLMADFRLEPFRKSKVKNLSQGVQRRIAVVQALLASPSFLFLDEPLNGMDAEERKFLITYLTKYARGRMVIVAAHELNEWEEAADTVIWIHRGRLRFIGSPTQWKLNVASSVWEGEIDLEDFERIPQELLIHFQMTEHRMRVRLMGKKQPGPEFMEKAPTLEDTFFLHMNALARRG
ncbi:ABC transporter ATP-binding protein [Paenibacillus sp. FSL H8-0457]|uniref:ATP-binding cassette domain-containing protein n=1 Tax=Bacillales TaxID=1385 RepID=UPI0003E25B53|nr:MULTISPECIES: ABC transporter ATP-binding protein [Paenibacillus]ETT61432.1 ABC transporter-like protein [Paenibacillus sp. FSL H8-457]MCM3261901.1 ABC transporter ATP-binding protein [Paenibacillus lautus]PCL89836.1 ABC transporter ATP-binding protein [Paenibacillus lautus]QOT10082.1 ABC transporter ATP-binding protein [Paenibacillus sp. JNUCC-32]WFB57901.1 ABC transporter ATP-binding protein [Paenibacillus sp. BR1-192]